VLSRQRFAGGFVFKLIVACDDARGIGYQNQIPWFIPGELANVKRLTTQVTDGARQNALIMGLSTWRSLPEGRRPLPGRLNLVLSTTATPSDVPGALLCRSLAEAEKLVASRHDIESVFVFGGERVYLESLQQGMVSEVFLTRIPGVYPADAHFPELPGEFTLISREPTTYGEITVHYERWARS